MARLAVRSSSLVSVILHRRRRSSIVVRECLESMQVPRGHILARMLAEPVMQHTAHHSSQFLTMMHRAAPVLTRPSAHCSYRGKFSSMLDMNGIAQANADTRINVGKNNKIQVVALDFHLITRSIEERRQLAKEEQNSTAMLRNTSLTSTSSLSISSTPSSLTPDTSVVEMMASLLNVKLGGDSATSKRLQTDDVSAILGSSDKKEKESMMKKDHSSSHLDVRMKYAAKLRSKIDGGFAGLELANSAKENTMKRGDASLHLVARDLISSGTMGGGELSNPSSTRWLATTGVGKLLSFLSSRSIQIALLPLPSTSSHPQSDADVERTTQEMETIAKQLPNVQFDLFVSDGRRRGEEKTERSNDDTAEDVLRNRVLRKMQDVPPLKFMVVSDRDDYLKAARNNGMFTCRVRPKNTRRGNITTSYDVEDVGSVQDAINDINGISFNSALKG